MAALAAIGPIVGAIGAGVSAVGTIAAGREAERAGLAEQQRLIQEGQARQTALEFEAAQLDIQAKNERALGQREAFQKKREKNLALSRLQTVAAGSGFTATDPTALALADEISKYGTLQEQTALYGGEAEAERLKLAAAGRRFSGQSALTSAYAQGAAAAESGRAARRASMFSAAGTILGGISGMAGKYGGGSTGGRYAGGFTPHQSAGGPLVINRYGS